MQQDARRFDWHWRGCGCGCSTVRSSLHNTVQLHDRSGSRAQHPTSKVPTTTNLWNEQASTRHSTVPSPKPVAYTVCVSQTQTLRMSNVSDSISRPTHMAQARYRILRQDHCASEQAESIKEAPQESEHDKPPTSDVSSWCLGLIAEALFHHSAIDADNLTGDVASSIHRQERHCACDLVRLADALQRRHPAHRRVKVVLG